MCEYMCVWRREVVRENVVLPSFLTSSFNVYLNVYLNESLNESLNVLIGKAQPAPIIPRTETLHDELLLASKYGE